MDDPAAAFGFITGEMPGSGWDGAWRSAPLAISRFSAVGAGTSITIVKRAPDGSETTRYSGRVVPTSAPSPWIEVEATWTHAAVDVSGLFFEPGDTLREFFSPIHPFNAFALFSPPGALKGWYGNVTFPAFLIGDAPDATLVWHDLYLDVVILADGSVCLLDDDELAASGVPESRPRFARAIGAARRDLIAAIASFHAAI